MHVRGYQPVSQSQRIKGKLFYSTLKNKNVQKVHP